MSVIFILVTASLIVAGGFLVAFIWSVKAGQYEDDYTPSVRMLFDDGVIPQQEDNSAASTVKSGQTPQSSQLNQSKHPSPKS